VNLHLFGWGRGGANNSTFLKKIDKLRNVKQGLGLGQIFGTNQAMNKREMYV
jgi:hypothetical protein